MALNTLPKVDSALLFQLLRLSLFDEPSPNFPSLPEGEWESLFRYSMRHKIVALVQEGIAKLPTDHRPDRKIWLRFCVERDNVESLSQKQHIALSELTQILCSMGVSTMLLKGEGLASCYPVPSLRQYGDLDIYQYGDWQRADGYMSDSMGIAVEDDTNHHTKFLFRGVMVENHYNFLNTRAFRSNRELDLLLKEWASESSVSNVADSGYRLPSPKFNALFLIRHLSGHFASGQITVRDLCDWRMFLQQYGSQVDWHEMWKVYQRYNMHRFVGALQALMEDYFRLEPITGLPREKDAALVARVMNDILYGEFSEPEFKEESISRVFWKLRRFKANRWKHRITYSDPWIVAAFTSTLAHLKNPRSIIHKV